MNVYFQVKNHLASIRKESCDKFDEHLMIKLASISGSLTFGQLYIISIYHEICKNVCEQYKDDCQVFSTCCPGNTDCYNQIMSRDLKKIEEYKDYKLVLALNKYEKEDGTIDKYTLQKWLSENAI